jgi:hypothetical protein
MSLECAHLGLVAGICSTYQANIGKSCFFYPNNCSIFVSDTCGMRVPICLLILCVMAPSLSLPCSAKRRGVEARKKGPGGRIWGWNVRFKAGGCRGCGVARHSYDDASRSGLWVQGARGGAGWVDQGGDATPAVPATPFPTPGPGATRGGAELRDPNLAPPRSGLLSS